MKFICSNLLVLNLLINIQFSSQAAVIHVTMLFMSVLNGVGEENPTSLWDPPWPITLSVNREESK